MALQCSQLCIPTSIRFDVTPKATAPGRRLTKGNLSQTGLKNSNISFQVRFFRHCERDSSRQSRQWNRATVCVRAGEKKKPTWVEMIPITGEAQFDEALESGSPVIIDWCSLFPLTRP